MVPEEQRQGIKNYIVQKIITLSSSDEVMAAEKQFLSKVCREL